jgi:hypothetical protein
MGFISCSDWIKLHPHAEEYFQYLIDNGKIAPAQADWLVKKIIIDEDGKKYSSDNDPDSCAFEIWSDIQDIPGHFHGSSQKIKS